MNRLISLIILSVMIAACAPSQATVTDSGVQGRVTIGPMCPVVRLDQPCLVRPQSPPARDEPVRKARRQEAWRLGIIGHRYGKIGRRARLVAVSRQRGDREFAHGDRAAETRPHRWRGLDTRIIALLFEPGLAIHGNA